jgi:hypothetical protein
VVRAHSASNVVLPEPAGAEKSVKGSVALRSSSATRCAQDMLNYIREHLMGLATALRRACAAFGLAYYVPYAEDARLQRSSGRRTWSQLCLPLAHKAGTIALQMEYLESEQRSGTW